MQVACNMPSRHFERHLHNLATHLLPQPNFCPPTLYLLKGLLHVLPGSRFEVHICEKECMQFEHRATSEYRQHIDECCSICGKPRFMVRKASNSGRDIIVPVKRFWYFTLAFVIRCLFGDPAFCKLRGTGRHEASGLYLSREARRLERLGLPVRDPDASLWTVGCDGGQVFDGKAHSVFMWALQCAIHALQIVLSTTLCLKSDEPSPNCLCSRAHVH